MAKQTLRKPPFLLGYAKGNLEGFSVWVVIRSDRGIWRLFLDNRLIHCYGVKCLYNYRSNTMQTTSDTQTRWTVSVPKETDIALRCFLAERGMKKGDMSKFIVDAVKWRVFEQTAAEIREKFADVPPEELQNIVDEACHAVRGEMRQELLKNKT